MQQAKLLLVTSMLTISALGCGDSTPTPAKVNELTPDAIAEQEAVLKEAADAETEHRKKNK